MKVSLKPTHKPVRSSNHTYRSTISHVAPHNSRAATKHMLHASSGANMTPEEEAAYQAVLDRKRAEREQQIKEYRRRVKFDPLDKSKVEGDASTTTSTPAPPTSTSTQNPVAFATSAPSSAPAAHTSPPSPAPPPISRPPPRMQPVPAEAPAPTPARPLKPAAASAASAPRTSPPTTSPSPAIPQPPKPLSEEEKLLAMLNRDLSRGTLNIPEASARMESNTAQSNIRSNTRSTQSNLPMALGAESLPTPAELAAGMDGMALSRKEKELLDLIKNMPDGDGDDGLGIEEEEEEEEDDGLDWDTLKAYESFDKYVTEENQANEVRAVKKAREEKQTRVKQPDAFAFDPKDPYAELNKLLNDMEQVANLFDVAEKQAVQNPKKKQGDSSTTGLAKSATDDSGIDVDSLDWSVLEQLLLDGELEKELEELDAMATAEEDEGAGAESGGDDEQPWEDEVSTFLLGMVAIAHQKYLGRPLLKQDVTEENRAGLFWKAPFALIVHDDTPKSNLEYANETALKLLGREFLDIYEMTSYDIINADPDAQQEWMWSIAEAEEKFEKFKVIPEVRMHSKTGKRFVAKNVLVFRVDSLEGDLVGQATVFSDWQFADA